MAARTRLPAEERQRQLLAAAVRAFSAGGYAGTTTDQVARLAGVSQPYVIRLFGTKQRLFLATCRHAGDRILQTFRAAAADQPDLAALSAAYDRLLAERDLITVLLHGFAAGADPEIGAAMRTMMGDIYTEVRALTGADPAEARGFLATGMLLTVLGAVGVVGPGAVPADGWMRELLDDLELTACRPS